jgi:hypothetical protein
MTRHGYFIRAWIKRYAFWWELGLTAIYAFGALLCIWGMALLFAFIHHEYHG